MIQRILESVGQTRGPYVIRPASRLGDATISGVAFRLFTDLLGIDQSRSPTVSEMNPLSLMWWNTANFGLSEAEKWRTSFIAGWRAVRS